MHFVLDIFLSVYPFSDRYYIYLNLFRGSEVTAVPYTPFSKNVSMHSSFRGRILQTKTLVWRCQDVGSLATRKLPHAFCKQSCNRHLMARWLQIAGYPLSKHTLEHSAEILKPLSHLPLVARLVIPYRSVACNWTLLEVWKTTFWCIILLIYNAA